MNTISDTLKKRKEEIEIEIASIDSALTSWQESIDKAEDTKTVLQNELSKLNNFLLKENELDALFNK